MNTKVKLVVAQIAFASFFCGTGLAKQLTIDRVEGYYYGNGGEFNLSGDDMAGYLAVYDSKAKAKRSTGSWGIETFCVETQEYVGIPATYYFQLNTAAIKGGQATSDPISVGTAWLYRQFAKGTLANYNYTAGSSREVSARDLQKTIWWLEGEGSDPGLGNSFRQAVVSAFNAYGVDPWVTSFYIGSTEVNAAYFGVFAVNLGTTYDGNGDTWPKQDQLIWNGGGLSIPEGGLTVTLLGMGIGGLSLLRRKIA